MFSNFTPVWLKARFDDSGTPRRRRLTTPKTHNGFTQFDGVLDDQRSTTRIIGSAGDRESVTKMMNVDEPVPMLPLSTHIVVKKDVDVDVDYQSRHPSNMV